MELTVRLDDSVMKSFNMALEVRVKKILESNEFDEIFRNALKNQIDFLFYNGYFDDMIFILVEEKIAAPIVTDILNKMKESIK